MSTEFKRGLQVAIDIINKYPYHATDGWCEVQDICDDLALQIKKEGSVAQTVTQHPAKMPAPQGVVGSNPTATATTVSGKHVAFTGKLGMTRDAAKARTLRAGGYPQDRITSWTQVLIVAANPGSKKWNEAIDKGLPMMSEDEWYRLTI